MTKTPNPKHVRQLRDLLDLLEDFPSNDQRARYLLTCNFMVDQGHAAAENARQGLARTMRNGGSSWQEIADRLGMSRQAAWKRFGGAS